MLALGVLAIAGLAALLLLEPVSSDSGSPEPEVALSADNARSICFELSENPKSYLSSDEWERRNARRTQSCGMAFAAEPHDLTLKVKVALLLLDGLGGV